MLPLQYTRVTKIPYSKEFILKSLENDFEFKKFKYGKSPLFCTHCSECNGYNPKKADLLFNEEHNKTQEEEQVISAKISSF